MRRVAIAALLLLTASAGRTSAQDIPRLVADAKVPTRVLFNSVTCPDTQTCFTVGTNVGGNGPNTGVVILASHDGGATWATTINKPKWGGADLSCSDARHCSVLDASYFPPGQTRSRTLLRTDDGGKSWHPSSVGPADTSGFGPSRLVCPSPTVCYLSATIFPAQQTAGRARTTARLLVTRNSGQTWTELRLPASTTLQPRTMTCISVTSCVVGGVRHDDSCVQAAAILRTDDGGATWVQQFGDCAAAISALDCPDTNTCYAGGWYGTADAVGDQLVLGTVDSGASWDDRFEGPIDPTYSEGNSAWPITGIACPAVRTCRLSAGTYLLATADGGATWNVQPSPDSGTLQDIACPTVRVCVAVGWIQPTSDSSPPTGLIVRTTDGGTTWTKA